MSRCSELSDEKKLPDSNSGFGGSFPPGTDIDLGRYSAFTFPHDCICAVQPESRAVISPPEVHAQSSEGGAQSGFRSAPARTRFGRRHQNHEQPVAQGCSPARGGYHHRIRFAVPFCSHGGRFAQVGPHFPPGVLHGGAGYLARWGRS